MSPLLLLLGARAFAFAPADHIFVGQEPVRHLLTHPSQQLRLRESAGWVAFTAGEGAGWVARFDEQTGTAHRAWGPGIDLGALQTEAQVRAAFNAFFARNEALLGVPARSLRLGQATRSGDGWILRFDRVLPGLPTAIEGRIDAPVGPPGLPDALGEWSQHGLTRVWRGGVEARVRHGKLVMIGVDTYPLAEEALAAPAFTASQAIALAIADGPLPEADHAVEGAVLVVLPQQDGPVLTHALCWMVRTRTGGVNPGLWVSFVDAQTGALLNVHNQVRYATGTVYGTHVTRTVDGDFTTSTMPWMDLSSSAGSTTTDADGAWTLGGSSFTGVLSGDWVDVKNGSGAEGSLTWSSGMPTWTEANATQAEIDSFVWQNKIHVWGQTWAPELDISNQQITSTVNLNDVCNAYYDGNVNFYKQGGGCNNTGQIADVNYHEWGHGFHAYAANTWSVDGSIGEGSGDAVSFFNTGDSVVAPYFVTDGSGIRDAGPNRSYPDDVVGQVHEDGLIWAGAIWDLWSALDATLGTDDGYATTVTLFKEALKANTSLEGSYDEVVVADDDDGNLANGTPNLCEIIDAFALHGLGPGGSGGLFQVAGEAIPNQLASASAYPVRAEVQNLAAACVEGGIDDATVYFSVDGGETYESAPLSVDGDVVTGDIPAQAEGSVVTWYVEVQPTGSDAVFVPSGGSINPMSFLVGEPVLITCFDFEDDDGGFTHELLSGSEDEGADDWMWDRPRGAGGDPDYAASGTRVWGNDLGGGRYNGQYQSNKTNRLSSPAIDVSGYAQTYVQFNRWLQIEDGYYDKANVYANEAVIWQNHATSRSVGDEHHLDEQWALTTIALPAGLSEVVLGWEIDSDNGAEYGGWTLDDVCVYGYVSAPVTDTGGEPDTNAGEGDDTGTDNVDDPGVDGSDSKGDFSACSCASTNAGGGGLLAGLLAGVVLIGRRRRA